MPVDDDIGDAVFTISRDDTGFVFLLIYLWPRGRGGASAVNGEEAGGTDR